MDHNNPRSATPPLRREVGRWSELLRDKTRHSLRKKRKERNYYCYCERRETTGKVL